MSRLLLNENFPAPSISILRAHDLNVLAMSEADASLVDPEVLAFAVSQDRILVTFDKDYGELVFARGLPPPPSVVLLRVTHYRPTDPAAWILDLIRDPASLAGQFVVLSDKGLRRRPLLRKV